MNHAVLRSKELNPYIFIDCEPSIENGVLSMRKDGRLIYAFAPGSWAHVLETKTEGTLWHVAPRKAPEEA